MITSPSIEHQVVSHLLKAGFSPETAAFYWAGVDQAGSVDDILERIMERVMSDGSADDCALSGVEEFSSNSEEPNPFSGDGDQEPVQAAPAAAKARGNFDTPPPEESKRETQDNEAEYRILSPEEIRELASRPDPDDEKPDAFPLHAVSGAMREAVLDWMRHLCIPALLPVLCALSALSVALGRGVYVLSNKARTFPNIFSVLGAQSGTGKSLVYDAAFAPLESVQEAVTEEFDDRSYHLRAKLGLLKKDIEVALAQYKKATDKGASLSDAERQAFEQKLKELHRQQEEMEDMLQHPPAVWTSDFTSEALGARLHNNNEVIAVLSDEGGIVLYDLIGRYSDGNFSDDMLLCKCFSVNSHAVDRITRGRIVLRRPCVALLLLVQPDILRRAFENTRLLIGGFLARCFAADTRLQMQEETDESAVHFDEKIALKWAELLMALYKEFHDVDKPYRIEVEPAVRVACRTMYNEIVQKVRYQLSDVSSFACRWVEQTWKVAIILHMAKHGINGIQKALNVDTFTWAKDIVRYFATKQLEVLAVMRREEIKKTHHRLQEIFIENNFEPLTLRTLAKTHNVMHEAVHLCVKAYPAVYGIVKRKNSQGGGYSMILFLKEHPPC